MEKETASLMKKLLAIGLLFFTSFASAQEQSFIYSKEDGVIRLMGDSSLVTLTDYIKTKDKTEERTVNFNGATYIITVAKTRVGKVQTITDAQGTRLATVFLGTVKRFNILSAGGIEFNWESPKATQWLYKVNGKEVIKGSYVKEGGVKKLFIQNLDSHLVAPVVLLSCMERGADIMDPSSRTGRMVIAAVLLAALRIALLGG